MFSFFGELSGANKTAIKNCKYVFPNMKEEEVKSIVKKSWDNLGRTISELPSLNYLFDKKKIKNDFEILSILRNLKIIGIFTRLAIRDKKKDYLKLIPYAWELISLRINENEIFLDLKKLLNNNFKKNL